MRENNKDYDKYLPYWQQIRVFVEGLRDVQEYLQGVSNQPDTLTNKRNAEYKARGKYVNFPARTRNALIGAVFRKDAKVEIPSKLEYILENANGAGKPLEQVSKHLVTNLVEVGRHGVFVDYGEVLGVKRAKIVTYSAENILDWETDEVGVLTHVVLFMSKDKYKHLILRDGAYIVEIRNEKDDVLETITPTKFDGSLFTQIPFIMVGSTDNAPDVDDMPIWSIVDVSQGHLQNSCDYEDILRYLIPTPAVTVPNKQWLDEMLPNGTYTFGDGSIIPLPDGGSATLLQASPNQMHQEAMKHKEEQLLMLGARLVAQGGQAETAEAVRIKYSAENNVLDNLVGNASSAIQKALEWCAEFEGIETSEIEYELNKQFWDSKLTPQEISAQMLMLDRGVKSMYDVRDTLRKNGEINQDRTDDEIDADAEVEAGGLGAE